MTLIIIICGCRQVTAEEISGYYQDLRTRLLPSTEGGLIDFESMQIDDHQYIAYLLTSESRSMNKDSVQQLTQYLVDHSDDNADGEIGWGLGYAWDAFSDGIENPAWHAYTIETINVMDAYVEALLTGLLSDDTQNKVKEQIRETVLLWNQKYWSDNGQHGEKYFYWYSISGWDAIGCINIDAKMIGTQARLIKEYPDLFSETEKNMILDHIDKCYVKVMQHSYFENSLLKWNYFEQSDSSPNDAIHHAFILEGISDYQKYRFGKEIIYNNPVYTQYIEQCISGTEIYSFPDHSTSRCFDVGAIQWVSDKSIQKQLLANAYIKYSNENTDLRQLAFLLNAFSQYLFDE